MDELPIEKGKNASVKCTDGYKAVPRYDHVPCDSGNEYEGWRKWNALVSTFNGSVHKTYKNKIWYKGKLVKMRAELASLNYCAIPFLSRTCANLCWYYYI